MESKNLMKKISNKLRRTFSIIAVLLAILFAIPVNSVAAETLPASPPSGYDQSKPTYHTVRSAILHISPRRQTASGGREFTCLRDIQQITNTASCIYCMHWWK